MEHVRRVPRRRAWRIPPRRVRRGRTERHVRHGRVRARPEAVPRPHRRIRGHTGGHGPRRIGQPRVHRGRRPHERHCGQSRGSHGHLVRHEAEVHRARTARRRAGDGRRGRLGHLPRRSELSGNDPHEPPHRHHGGGGQHHDALLSDHRTGTDEVSSPHARTHAEPSGSQVRGEEGRGYLHQTIPQDRRAWRVQLLLLGDAWTRGDRFHQDSIQGRLQER
mmetsp:Transcript_19287/g.56284  ORF Transcript_19287/g.56284 Transcript_19287/m.56284 type:complete len:220 (-) Transcript_19287:1005-1664(-)